MHRLKGGLADRPEFELQKSVIENYGQIATCEAFIASAIRARQFCLRAAPHRTPTAYPGGGAVEAGAGFPSIVPGSISSVRVPSGSNRFA